MEATVTPRPRVNEGSESVKTSACDIEEPTGFMNLAIDRSNTMARTMVIIVALY